MKFAGIIEPGVASGQVTSAQYVKGSYAVFDNYEELLTYFNAYRELPNSVIIPGMPLFDADKNELWRVSKTETNGLTLEKEQSTQEIQEEIAELIRKISELDGKVESVEEAVAQAKGIAEEAKTKAEEAKEEADIASRKAGEVAAEVEELDDKVDYIDTKVKVVDGRLEKVEERAINPDTDVLVLFGGSATSEF